MPTARPNRLYKTKKGRLFYLINGKKKYLKVPKGISQKQLIKINIKNIIGDTFRKLKRRKKRVPVKYEKKIVPEMEKSQGTIPFYYFQYQKRVPTIREKEGVPESGYTAPKTIAAIENKPPNTDKLESLLLEYLKKGEPKTKAIEGPKKTAPPIPPKKAPPAIEAPPKLPAITEGARSVEAPKRPSADEAYARLMAQRRREETEALSAENTRKAVELAKKRQFNRAREQTEMAREDFNVSGTKPEESKTHEGPEGESKDEPASITTTKPNKNIKKAASTMFESSGLPRTREAYAQWIKDNGSEIMTNGGRPGGKTLSEYNIDLLLNDLFKTEGSGYEQDGLYNTELETILKKKVKDFVPVIAKNELGHLDQFVSPKMKRFGFVINTASLPKAGSTAPPPAGHWQSVFINNEDDYPSIEFYDPLVSKPPPCLVTKLKHLAQKINPESTFLFKVNNLKRQANTTSTCGFHAVGFIEDRMSGLPWSEVTGYDDFMAKHKPDDSQDGESDIKKKIKKYNKYL